MGVEVLFACNTVFGCDVAIDSACEGSEPHAVNSRNGMIGNQERFDMSTSKSFEWVYENYTAQNKLVPNNHVAASSTIAKQPPA